MTKKVISVLEKKCVHPPHENPGYATDNMLSQQEFNNNPVKIPAV
jgi:hypothetical protein